MKQNVYILWLVIATILAPSLCLGESVEKVGEAGNSVVSVIVLPVEGQTAQATVVDVAISKQLAAEKNLVIVDRSMIEAVLAEKTMAGEFRKKLTGGGWILSGKVVDVNGREFVLFVDVVSARTGDTLSGQSVPLPTGMAAEKIVKRTAQAVRRTIAEARAVSKRNQRLLEVSGSLKQAGRRLEWMRDDLVASLGGSADRLGLARCLRARLPLATKEERLLKVLGVARAAKDGDGNIRFSPLPDAQLRFVLTDSMKAGVSFNETPISLQLTYQSKAGKSKRATLSGTVGGWDALKAKAEQWLAKQLVTPGIQLLDPIEAEKQARRRSREIVAALQPTMEQTEGYSKHRGRGYKIRRYISSQALRALHLDPTNETAAWLVAYNFGWQQEDSHTRKANAMEKKRALIEMFRFFERFPKASASRQYRLIIGNASNHCLHLHHYIIKKPLTDEMYALHSTYARRLAEVYVREKQGAKIVSQVRGAPGEFLASFLRYSLIPKTGDAFIDQEHAFWKEYYAKEITPLLSQGNYNWRKDPLPWAHTDALFWARKKNAPAVKNALNELAKQFPKSHGIWETDSGLHRDSLVVRLLRQAGAPDAKTWSPAFAQSNTIRVPYRRMERFLYSLRGGRGTLSPWDSNSLKQLSCPAVVLPESVLGERGKRRWWNSIRTQLLPIDRHEIWVLLNRQPPKGSSRICPSDARIIALQFDDTGKQIRWSIDVPYPSPTTLGSSGLTSERLCLTVHEKKPTVWIATEGNGLLQYTSTADGEWTFRRYTGEDGLPFKTVRGIRSVRGKNQRLILLAGYNPKKRSSEGALAVFNPTTNEFSLATKMTRHGGAFRQAKTTTGRLLSMRLLEQGVYDVELSDISEYMRRYHDANLVLSSDQGVRLFKYGITYGAGGDQVICQEFDETTLKRLSTSLGCNNGGMNLLTFQSPRRSTRPMGNMIAGLADTIAFPGRWPAVLAHQTVTQKDIIWIVYSTAGRVYPSARYIVGYRPAPKGDAQWAKNDQWIGPFESPDGRIITGLTEWGNDRLAITTRRGMYITSADDVLKQAKADKALRSTQQWRDGLGDRLAATNWRAAVICHIGNGDYPKVDATLDKVTDPKDQLHRAIWRAVALARQKKWEPAAKGFQQAVTRAQTEKQHAAEAYARVQRIMSLHAAGLKEKAREALAVTVARLPQLAPTKRDMLYEVSHPSKHPKRGKK